MITAVLMARRVRGALLLGILATTIIAVVLNGVVAGWSGFSTPGAARIPATVLRRPDFSTFGRVDFGFVAKLGLLTAALVTFSVMRFVSYTAIRVLGGGARALHPMAYVASAAFVLYFVLPLIEGAIR